jgi:hypothetical protein
MSCICGGVRDEHGGDLAFPGSTACRAIHDGVACDCVAYEDNGEDDEEDDVDDDDEDEDEEDGV